MGIYGIPVPSLSPPLWLSALEEPLGLLVLVLADRARGQPVAQRRHRLVSVVLRAGDRPKHPDRQKDDRTPEDDHQSAHPEPADSVVVVGPHHVCNSLSVLMHSTYAGKAGLGRAARPAGQGPQYPVGVVGIGGELRGLRGLIGVQPASDRGERRRQTCDASAILTSCLPWLDRK